MLTGRSLLQVADHSPPHEVAVERYAAEHAGAFGPQTLEAVMRDAARSARQHGRAGAGLAVALAHLAELGGHTAAEMAGTLDRSRDRVAELLHEGRAMIGAPPRRAGRRRAAG